MGGGQEILLLLVGEGGKGLCTQEAFHFYKAETVFLLFGYFKGLWIIWKEMLEVWTLKILQASNSNLLN